MSRESCFTKDEMDTIECEWCGSHLGYANGDLNCLNLTCDSCYGDLEDK